MDKKTYQNKYLFDYLKNILITKSLNIYNEHISDEENFKSFPSMVIFRYLSMSCDLNIRYLVLKNQILLERLYSNSPKGFYLWCLKNIPKQNSSFIKYIK